MMMRCVVLSLALFGFAAEAVKWKSSAEWKPSAEVQAQRLKMVDHKHKAEHVKTGDWEKLQYFKNALVSCKGEVRLKDEAQGLWSMAPVAYDGCGFNRGSCAQPKWSRGPRLQGPATCRDPRWETYPPNSNCSAPVLDRIVVITQPQWGAYYHFLIDSFPRITWVKDQAPHLLTDPNTYFHLGLANEIGQGWARLVGIPTEIDADQRIGAGRFLYSIGKGYDPNPGQFSAASSGTKNRLLEGYWEGKEVVWPPSNGCVMGKHHAEPKALAGLRSLVAKQLAGSSPMLLARQRVAEKKTVLLVRRHPRAGQARSIKNHDEILKALRDSMPKFNVVEFSDWPAPDVPTTCRIFASADIIVGPHGAGFANLICAKEKVPLVEIQQKPHAHDFELLSGFLGLPYYGVPTEMSHGKAHTVPVAPVLAAVQKAAADAGF